MWLILSISIVIEFQGNSPKHSCETFFLLPNLQPNFQKAGQIIFWDQNVEAQTCGVDDAIGADGPVRGPDIPLAVSGGFERRHRSRVVDLGSVHTRASGQSHCQRVRVNVSVPWRVQPWQHLQVNTNLLVTTDFGNDRGRNMVAKLHSGAFGTKKRWSN